MSEELNKLICNLIGTLEVLDIALKQNDHIVIYQAHKKMMEQIAELKKHEHYTHENGVYYE